MALNSKVALLLLGLLLGAIAGYLTRPESAQIKIGDTSIEFQNNKVSTNSSGSLTSGQTQHIFLYAAIGGVIGLLVGFAPTGAADRTAEMAFKFELVSPEKLLFSGDVESVTAPGIEGEFTVLKDHAPFMTTLKPGKVVIAGGGKDEEMFVKGGFADVSPEGFTILADYALPMAEIGREKFDADIAAAEKAAEDAIGDETKRLALEHRDQLREFQAGAGK